jgi:ribosome modulation factor
MTNATAFNPHKEEDEGYLAAESGRKLSDNPYPRGTIRHSEWQRGWQVSRSVIRQEENDGYQAAEGGRSLTENPYPRGTIRYDQWRRGWQRKCDEIQRAVRLGRE